MRIVGFHGIAWRQRRDPAGSYGPLLVIIFAALGVALWAVSQPTLPVRTDIGPTFAAWVAVAITAAGVYGFVRTVGAPVVDAVAERVRLSPPPTL